MTQRRTRNPFVQSGFLAAALIALAILTPGTAQASCASGAANGNGGTDYTVSDAESGTCTLSAHDTLTVTSSGSINGAFPTVSALSGATSIANGGLINSSAVDLYNGGTITALTNTATISGTGDGGVAIDNHATITGFNNSGVITSNGISNVAVYNASSALISTITNSGIITAIGGGANYAIQNSGGTINALVNTGTISSAAQYVIYNTGTFGSIDNNGGTIDGSAASIAIDNTGGSGITTITNENGGLIIGSDEAIYSTTTIGTINNKTGSTMTSEEYTIWSDGGSIGTINNDGLITTTSVGFAGVTNEGALGIINNTGTISGQDVGIYNDSTIGTINNSTGTITSVVDTGAAEGAIFNSGIITTITNGGNILGAGGDGLNNTGTISALTNTGTINSTFGSYNAITSSGTIGTITNSGTITSSDDGQGGISNESGTIGTITNQSGGTIGTTGATGFGIYNNVGTIGGITNVGTITGGSGYAIYNNDGGTITSIDNQSGGLINTTTGGVITIINTGNSTIGTLTNEVGAVISGTDYIIENDIGSTITTLTNSGTIGQNISGTYPVLNYGLIGSFTNTGTIASPDEYTVYNTGTITTLNNSGTISTESGVAIYNSGAVALVNTGTISATSGTALYTDHAISIDNTGGTIIATDGGIALQLDHALSATLTNTNGTITANGGVALYVNSNLGNQTIAGGTIANTGTDNSDLALAITSTQTGTISFNGVSIIADGDTAGSGHATAFDIDTGGTVRLSFDSASVVRGAITQNGNGAVLITDAAPITGDITTTGGNDVLTINSGGSVNGNIDLGGGTNALALNTSFATGGTITTSGAINATITGGATFTVNNAVDLGTGNLTNRGTIVIGNGETLTANSLNTIAGAYTFNTGSTSGALTSGHIALSSAEANMTNDTFAVGTITGGALDTTTSSLIVSGFGAATLPVSLTVADNSYLYNFGLALGSGGGGNSIYLTVSMPQTLQQAADTNSNYLASTILLNGLNGSSDATVQQIQDNLDNAPTRAAYNNVLAAVQPTVDDGAPTAAASFSGQALDTTDDQLLMINTGGALGMAAGSQPYGLHAWMQGFGQHADEDTRGGVSGYNADTYGAAFGVDTRNLGKDNVAGLSFAYGRSNVYSQDINSAYTNVDTYQLTAYGNHSFADDYFMAGMLSYGWDDNTETRHDVGGVSGLDASGNYDSWQGAGRIEGGKNFALGDSFGGAVVTPMAVGDYLHYYAHAYTESGAGGADLHVNGANEDVLNLGLSGRIQWLLPLTDDLRIRPDLHASYMYDVLNNSAADTTASFTAGGSTFSTNGLNPSRSTFDIGAGAKLYSAGNWDFTAEYDFTVKPDYTANSGMIRAAYQF